MTDMTDSGFNIANGRSFRLHTDGRRPCTLGVHAKCLETPQVTVILVSKWFSDAQLKTPCKRLTTITPKSRWQKFEKLELEVPTTYIAVELDEICSSEIVREIFVIEGLNLISDRCSSGFMIKTGPLRLNFKDKLPACDN